MDGQSKTTHQTAGDDLGMSRRSLERFYPARVGRTGSAPPGSGTPPNRSSRGAQRHHLSDADRMPVECPAVAFRGRQFGSPNLPTVDHEKSIGSDLGPVDRALRGTGRRGLAMAERRRGHGQGAFWGDQVGPNPTDRAKNGTKKSLVVEGDGGPLGVVIAPANRHDAKLLSATIAAIVVERPEPNAVEQHLCLDKGYDNPSGAEAALANGYVPHVRRIGEEKLDRKGKKTKRARRWEVERTLAWLNRCRAILIRYTKKAVNYLGRIPIACTLLWYRQSWRLLNLR